MLDKKGTDIAYEEKLLDVLASTAAHNWEQACKTAMHIKVDGRELLARPHRTVIAPDREVEIIVLECISPKGTFQKARKRQYIGLYKEEPEEDGWQVYIPLIHWDAELSKKYGDPTLMNLVMTSP